MHQRTTNLAMIADLYDHLEGEPTAILMANFKDWLHIRRDFMKSNIRVVRDGRRPMFKVLLDFKHIADLYVDIESRLPLRDDQLFLFHKPDLLLFKPEIEVKQYDLSTIWTAHWGLGKVDSGFSPFVSPYI